MSFKARHDYGVDTRGRVMSHACIYVILITVSCTGDYEHPYYAYADNEEYAEEEPTEEALPSTEF